MNHRKIIFLTIFVMILLSNLSFAYNIPVANIVVDGDQSDWRDIPYVVNDEKGDSNTPQHIGTDMKRLYVAANEDRNILYFKLSVYDRLNDEKAPPPKEAYSLVQYLLAFDNPDVNSYGSWCDWQVGFNNLDFWIWDLSGQTGY